MKKQKKERAQMGEPVSNPVVWVDEEHGFRVMPHNEDRAHAFIEVDEICTFPRAVYNDDTEQFEYAEDEE